MQLNFHTVYVLHLYIVLFLNGDYVQVRYRTQLSNRHIHLTYTLHMSQLAVFSDCHKIVYDIDDLTQSQIDTA